MKHLIDKDALVAEIDKLVRKNELYLDDNVSDAVRFQKTGAYSVLCDLRYFINTLEVKNPYEQCIQYPSVKDGIEAHAETYSFNIESELFNQLTKEQQPLWRKEIEQACISGGEAGVELARDPRYKENLEVKDVDIENVAITEWNDYVKKIDGDPDNAYMLIERGDYIVLAKHFFELALKTSNPLTWEDMMTIHKCIKDAMNLHLYEWSTIDGQQKIYEDVLKRFKAKKGK